MIYNIITRVTIKEHILNVTHQFVALVHAGMFILRLTKRSFSVN